MIDLENHMVLPYADDNDLFEPKAPEQPFEESRENWLGEQSEKEDELES